MSEERRTREELLQELAQRRREVAELEQRLELGKKATTAPAAATRQDRIPLDTTIEFIGDFDVAKARGVDLSEGGVCFELDEDLPFEMRFKMDGKEQTRRARCVWLRSKPDKGYFLGLQFIEPEPGESF